jgi:uncharacterized protein DUF3987
VLVAAPESAAGTRKPRAEQATTQDALEACGKILLAALERSPPLKNDRANELIPRPLPLSEDARKAFFDYVAHIEDAIGLGCDLEPVKGFANKLPEHAARLAAVLALVEDITAPEVSADDLHRGIELADYYASEALRIFESSRAKADLVLAERLRQWMHSKWTENVISLPDIYQRSLNAISDQATARKMVNILTEHGWLEPIPRGAVVAGQRRREAWRIIRGS